MNILKMVLSGKLNLFCRNGDCHNIISDREIKRFKFLANGNVRPTKYVFCFKCRGLRDSYIRLRCLQCREVSEFNHSSPKPSTICQDCRKQNGRTSSNSRYHRRMKNPIEKIRYREYQRKYQQRRRGLLPKEAKKIAL